MARMKMAPYPYPDSLSESKLPALQPSKGLSRLEAMRSEYQERNLRAKEKMVTLLNQQQERITQRLNGTLSRIKQPQEQSMWAPEEREWASNWTVPKRSAGVDRAHPLKPVSHHQASLHPASATGMRSKVTSLGQEHVRSKSGPSRPTTWQQLERKESNLEAEIRRKEAMLLEKLRRTEEELRRIQREKAEAVLEERSGQDRGRWKEEHGGGREERRKVEAKTQERWREGGAERRGQESWRSEEHGGDREEIRVQNKWKVESKKQERLRGVEVERKGQESWRKENAEEHGGGRNEIRVQKRWKVEAKKQERLREVRAERICQESWRIENAEEHGGGKEERRVQDRWKMESNTQERWREGEEGRGQERWRKAEEERGQERWREAKEERGQGTWESKEERGQESWREAEEERDQERWREVELQKRKGQETWNEAEATRLRSVRPQQNPATAQQYLSTSQEERVTYGRTTAKGLHQNMMMEANRRASPNTADDSSQWVQEQGEAELGEERVPCQLCGRRFMEQRLEKHMQVCQKMQTSTRKVFDSSKARAKGTDLEQFLRSQGRRPAQDPEVKGSSWRQKHESFMRTIRQARVVQNVIARGGKVSELPPPPPEENPDYETCPHCSRRFAPRAAERHIPKCATIKNKPRPPPARRR